jgi:hypothetical protein
MSGASTLLAAAERASTVFSPWHPIRLNEGPDAPRALELIKEIAQRQTPPAGLEPATHGLEGRRSGSEPRKHEQLGATLCQYLRRF